MSIKSEILEARPFVIARTKVESLPIGPHPSLVGSSWLLKRSLDVFGAGLGLILLAPVFLMIAILIKIDSRGPIIYRQTRVGLYGRKFEMFKFRSMAVDADKRKQELLAFNEMEGPIFKMAEDPRVTRFGKFIRKTSLDEFPQLVNILLGQMSLVGPRPPLPSEVEEYTDREWARLTVIPGATGLWQVSGRSSLSSFKEMVDLDLRYMREWSIFRDLRILLRTVSVVVKMEGSC